MKLFDSMAVAVGGGKGGVGKSFFAANLACSLAQQGRSVVLVDADLSGANIHTLFGIKYPDRTLTDFLRKKIPAFQDILLPTALANLRLICGASDLLEVANPLYAQKQKLLTGFSRLDADVVVIDIGAGASLNNLDFFNFADVGILMATPSPTSLQNAYAFLKLAVQRRVLSSLPDQPLKQEAAAAFGNNTVYKNMNLVLEHLAGLDASLAGGIRSSLDEHRYRLVVNMATGAESDRVAKALGSVVYQYLNVSLSPLGTIPYDSAVENSIRRMEPLLLSAASSMSGTFSSMARRLFIDQPSDAQAGDAPSRTTAAAKPHGDNSSAVQLCLHDEEPWMNMKLHVQTEDLGMEKAEIVTLVFSGGRILYSQRLDYRDALGMPNARHTVAERVKRQHLDALARIRDGSMDTTLAAAGKGA